MKIKILIVEDEYVEANDLRLILEKAGYEICGLARSVHQALEISEQIRPDIALLDITLKGKLTGIDLAKMLALKDIPFIFLSANFSVETLEAVKSTQPYGYLVKPFRTNDVLAAIEIASYRFDNNREALLRQQSLLQSQLDAIITDESGRPDKLLKIGKALQSYFPFDYMGCEFYEDDIALKGTYSFYRVGFDEYQEIAETELAKIVKMDVQSYAFIREFSKSHRPEICELAESGSCCLISEIQKKMMSYLKMKMALVIPVELQNGKWFWIYLGSKQAGIFTGKHLDLIDRLKVGLADALKSVLEININQVNNRLVQSVTPPAVDLDHRAFSGIIGKSHLLLNVFDQIKQVAPMDTSVLILGESGTGKEKIAECIHRLSKRTKGPFIKINCAGFSPSLIESELFGHEKGAFTGALERRIGKFELADKGTIFLDEIGDMPLESQVKILRVLQERQLERVGGRNTTKVDIRIIAATNKNLETEVANDRFRLDLYYRLNVFPITIPALRDRSEDIPLLVQHFIELFNQKNARHLRGVNIEVLDIMQKYQWPGNIRELEHFMERSLIMCRGDLLESITLPGIASSPNPKIAGAGTFNIFKSYKDFEKDYLLAVLEKCNGRLSGKNGAAGILGLPVSTLNSKLIKHGIKKERE